MQGSAPAEPVMEEDGCFCPGGGLGLSNPSCGSESPRQRSSRCALPWSESSGTGCFMDLSLCVCSASALLPQPQGRGKGAQGAERGAYMRSRILGPGTFIAQAGPLSNEPFRNRHF